MSEETKAPTPEIRKHKKKTTFLVEVESDPPPTQQHKTINLDLKAQLIRRIQIIMGSLEENIKDNYEDILNELNQIKSIAEENGFPQIPKISVFSILRDKLQRLPETLERTNFVKRQIESPFRTAKIEKMDYQELEAEKLKEKAFIVHPNLWGKGFKTYYWGNGFNEDDHNDFRKISQSKQQYNYALEYVNYVETVHQVNRIFFQGLRNKTDTEDLLKKIQFVCSIGLGVVLLLLVMKILETQLEYILHYLCFGFILFLSVTEVYSASTKFYNKPKNQTQVEKITEDIQKYFDGINNLIMSDDSITHKYKWTCPEGCLYLEVKFLEEIPMQSSEESANKEVIVQDV